MATKKRSIPLADSGIDWTKPAGEFTPISRPDDAPPAEEAPKSGMLRRYVGDTAASLGRGAVQGVRMLADTAGADNAVSTGLRSVEDFIGGLQSASAKADQQEMARILKDAEGKGVLDQVVAGFKAFGVAPLQTMAQAAGTSLPTIGAALIPGVGPAAMAARFGAPLALGAAQGAGAVKSSIYDEVKQRALQEDRTPAEAEQLAVQAQEYGGANSGQIALGAGLGAWAGKSGLEGAAQRLAYGTGGKAAGGMASRVAMGAVAEGIPEALQGGQEKFASNTAQTNAGFPTAAMGGVVANATMEGLAGHAMGGALGIPNPGAPAPVVDPGAAIRATKQPEGGPMTRAANAAIEAQAQAADAGMPGLPTMTAEQEQAALAAIESQGGKDAKGLRQFAATAGRAAGSTPDATGGAAAPGLTQPGTAPDEPSAAVGDMPFSDRVLTLQEQLGDQATRQALRDEFGDDALSQATYYASIADRPDVQLPNRTRDNMLALAERMVSMALLKKIDQPGLGGTGAAPDQLAGPSGVAPLQIGLDTEPTGTIRVDSEGNAAPETRADAIDTRQAAGTAPTSPGDDRQARKASAVNADPSPAAEPKPAGTPALGYDTTPTGRMRAGPAGVAPETAAEAINTRQGQRERDAEAQRRADLGLTPDVQAVQDRNALPKPLASDIKNPKGEPFTHKRAAETAQKKAKGGTVLQVAGGWVVRPDANSATVAPLPETQEPANAQAASVPPAAAPTPEQEGADRAGAGAAEAAAPGAAGGASGATAAVEADGVKPRKTLQEARTDAALDKEVAENGKRMPRRKWVEGKVSEGLKTRVTQEDRIKPMSRMQSFRANNEEQRAHELKIKAAGKKDVYWIGDYEVTKIEHDYANALAAAAATPAPTPVEAGSANAAPTNAEAPVQAASTSGAAAPADLAPSDAPATPKAQAVNDAPTGRKGERTLQEQVERSAAPGQVVATVGAADAEGERKFYVTMVRGDRVARLAGPFDTKDEADAVLPRAKDVANESDPRSAFDAFGVSGITSTNHKPGTLNERLGIGEPPAPGPARSPEADQRAAVQDVAERRRKAAEYVRQAVTKRTNANSAMVWQIIGPDGEAVSGPPGKYPGSDGPLAGSATMGNLGWGTKREADAALAELNRKADEILGAAAPAPQPVAELAAEAPAAPMNTEDAGAELTYNRRNRIKSGIKWTDIASKNDALKVKEAVKQNVYPRPDYQALVDGGMQPLAAHLVKQVYDAIAVKPNTRSVPTDADLQTYIAGVNRVMAGVLAWANDPVSLSKWATREARFAGAMLGKSVDMSELAPGDGKTMLESVYPEGWKSSQAELLVLGSNKLLGALQPGYDEARRAVKAVGAGWPASQEAWEKRGIKIIHADKIDVSYYEGKRTRSDEPYVSISYRVGGQRLMDQLIDGAESKDDLKVQAAVAAELEANQGMFIVMDKARRIVGKQETEDAAKDVARELTKREGKDGGPDDSGIDVAMARREGPPRRMEGENVSSDKLKEDFGLKGVNFGTWMKGDTPALRAERQAHLNHAYDSFSDLAELLGVPPKALSLNGMLGLAIGAQGNGKYAAHFVPGVNEINLTRASGAGSLAHEFGHALDHYFATQAGFAKRDEPFLTEHTTSVVRKVVVENGRQRMVVGTDAQPIRPEIVERFKAIVQAMNKKPETLEQFNARQEAGKERAKASVQGWLKSIRRDYVKAGVDEAAVDAITARILALDLGDGKIMVSPTLAVHPVVDDLRALYRKKAGRVPPIDQIKGLQSNLDYYAYAMSEKPGAVDHVPQQVSTDYATAAAGLDKGKGGKRYWSTNLEKFARAFDAFVSDELEARAGKNTYLSHAGRTGETVPMGDERTAINAAIKALVGEVQTRTDAAGSVALFSRATDDADERNALAALAENDDLFALPKSSAFTVAGIAADIDPGIKITPRNVPGESRYDITLPDGTTARLMMRPANKYGLSLYGFSQADGVMTDQVTERPGDNPEDAPDADDVFIDASLLSPGGGGAVVYQIAATYAHNTGRIFIGDPAGLSDDALRRRPEQMLSSALKFGTTAHIAPHPRQIAGDAKLGVPPLRWVYGDDIGNIRRLAELTVKAVENQNPDASNLTFDPATGQFTNSTTGATGRAPTKELLYGTNDAGRAGADGRMAATGRRTLARYAVFSALLREARESGATGGRRDGLLARLARLASDARPALAGTFYSRPQSQLRPATGRRQAVEALVQQIAARWANAPEVVVLDSMNDPRVPEAVRKEDQKQQSQGAAGEPEGFFYGGKVYLIAPQLAGDADVVRVLFHETLGHFGLRGTFGKDLGGILDRVAILQAAKVRVKAKQYGLDYDKPSDRRAAAEEVLAEMAQTTPTLGWGQKAIAAVRTWLRVHVPGFRQMGLSDTEIVRSYILPARAFVQRGGPAGGPGSGVRFSRETAKADIDRAWRDLAQAYGTAARFSRTPMADAVRSFSQAGARNAFIDAVTTHGRTNLWTRTVGTQYHKAKTNPTTFGRVFDAVQDYIKDTSVFANRAADNAPSLLPKLDSWLDLKKGGLRYHGAKPADTAKAGEAIFRGTLDKVLYDDETLASRFGLNELQRGLYREFRAAVDESLDGMAKSEMLRLAGDDGRAVRAEVLAAPGAEAAAEVLTAHLTDMAEQTANDDLLGTVEQIGQKVRRVQQLKGEGYAPLMRFGKHTLHVQRPDGATEFFGMYESVREANMAARAMRADPALAGMTFTQGVMSEEGHKLFNGMSLDALELFADATGNAQNPVYQEYLKLALSNRSAMKRMIERKAIKGYSDDVARVLASFVTSNARMSAGNLHLTDAKKMAEAIPKEVGDLRDDAIKLVDYVTNPVEEAATMRALLFVSFIGGSVASALVNMTQPLTMTLPYLTQWGGVAKAGKRLTAAMAMVASGRGMDAELAGALARAEQDGIVSPQEIHHLQAEAMNTLGKRPFLKKAAFVWGAMFSLAEQFNRRVSFVAAYQTAQAEGIANPFEFAEAAVVETQGLYNKGNKANWARGAIGATAMTFKQFSTHYLEWLVRMARSGPEGRRAVAVALALLLLTAGAGGLPFADDLDDLIDTLGQAMGHDTNSKRWKRQFVAQTLGLGDVAAEVATRGLSALPGMPMDLSLRMGMGNLLPATGLFLRSNTDTGRQLLEIAGAAGGLAANVLDGVKKAAGGDVAGGVMNAMPVAVQNMAKAVQMWDTGEFRNKKGALVMETDGLDAAMKFISFQPASVARESNRVNETLRTVQLAKNVEGEIAGRWAQGMADNDQEAVRAARQELADWNKANPQAPIRITMPQVLQRLKALRATRAERTLKQTPKELRPMVSETLR